MNTKALKQKILDLAIHGKLLPLEQVEKIRKEEPASVLLKKFRAEKEEKIAKGELKRNKNDSFIFLGDDKRHYEKFADGSVKDIEDEIPFDVPDGWSWCRLPNLCSIPITDGTHKTPTYSDKENGIPFLSSKDVTSGKIDWSKIKYITNDLHEELYNRIAPKKNDILLAKNGTTGVGAIVEDDTIFDIYVTLAVIRPILKVINPKYLLYVINSQFCKNQFNEHLTGIGVPNLHLVDINKTLIPISPLSEQQLIVAEIEKIFTQIDLLEQNKTYLQTAIKQAKSKILDLAIHGKLVPQDPNDEPASVLLKKIRAEKEAKIAKGELKRDKKDSYIYKGSDNCHYEKMNGKDVCIEDELPFAIPDNWQWCRIAYLVSINLGLTHTPKYVKTGIPFYSVKDISNGYLDESNPKYVTQEEFDSFLDGAKPKKGDIIFCRVGTIGKPHIVNVDYSFGIFVSVGFFRKFSTKIDSRFITNWMNSSLFSDQVEYNVKGGVIKNLNTGWLSDFFIPIPPLAEQQRIVSKIEELFSLLDQIQTNLI